MAKLLVESLSIAVLAARGDSQITFADGIADADVHWRRLSLRADMDVMRSSRISKLQFAEIFDPIDLFCADSR